MDARECRIISLDILDSYLALKGNLLYLESFSQLWELSSEYLGEQLEGNLKRSQEVGIPNYRHRSFFLELPYITQLEVEIGWFRSKHIHLIATHIPYKTKLSLQYIKTSQMTKVYGFKFQSKCVGHYLDNFGDEEFL